MADDIFLSPEEQDERAKQWLKDNGPAIAIGIALGIGAIIGFNKYKDGIQQNAEQASALFSTALDQVNESESADIAAQVTKLKEEHTGSSYASKASLIKATQLAKTNLDAAYTELQWVVDNAPEKGLKHTAIIRQANESHYNEILGDIEVKAGNLLVARTYYEAASDALTDADFAYKQVLGLKLDRLPVPEESSE